VPPLAFALDEDVSHDLAVLLRLRGLNAKSAKELGRLRLTDSQVLLRAVEDRQTLITHNGKDFLLLHEALLTWGRRWEREIVRQTERELHLPRHAGIAIIPHGQPQHLAAILEEFAARSAGLLDDRLFIWSAIVGWEEMHAV
jgi:hypothetical protein